MPVTSDTPGPYAPPAVILDVIRRFRDRGMQTPFTIEVLGRAGVTESLVRRTLQSLRTLDLIDDDGNPTEVLDRLAKAPEAELPERIREWLLAAYADVFRYVNPEQDDPTQVRDAFRSYEPRGQQDRMVTLFLRLCEEGGLRGPARSEAPARPRQPRPRRDSPQPARRRGAESSAAGRRDEPGTEKLGLPQPIAGLLASLPQSGRWSKGQRDKFLATFTAVIDFCIEVGDDSLSQDGEEGDP
jgi:hypothetical protein